jgi:hypothetical protein
MDFSAGGHQSNILKNLLWKGIVYTIIISNPAFIGGQNATVERPVGFKSYFPSFASCVTLKNKFTHV